VRNRLLRFRLACPLLGTPTGWQPRQLYLQYRSTISRIAEIARVLGLAESRVCQIYTQAVDRLRVFLLARLN
jgi:hypothetical protein